MEKAEKKMYHLDDLIDGLGGFGRFQYLMFVGIYSIFWLLGWSMLQMMYGGMIPSWLCVISQHLIRQDGGDGLLNEANTYSSHGRTSAPDLSKTIAAYSAISEKKETLNVCSVNGTACEMFIFLTTSRTIMNEWNLICDMKWVKQIVISVQMCGVWLGAIVSGQLGDRCGRRKTFYIFVLLHVITNIIAGFSVSWEMFTACRFLIGVAIGAILVVTFPYTLELFPAKSRSFLGFCPAFGIGTAVFSGVASLLDNWSHLHFACAAVSLPYLIGWFYFPDSIRWLAVQGRVKEAMDAINKIARLNRKPVPNGTIQLLNRVAQDGQEVRQKAYSYLDIIKHSAVRKIILIQGYFWFAMTVVFYGISFGVPSFHGNIFLNSFLMSAMTVVTSILLIFTVDMFKRRTLSLVLSFMIVMISAGSLFISLGSVDAETGDIISGLSLTAYILSYPLWNVMGLWGTELLPTVVRNLGYGWFNSASRLAGIVVPFIMNFDDSTTTPYIVIGALLIVCFILCFLLPETRGQMLADSLTDTPDTPVTETDRCRYTLVQDADPEEILYYESSMN